MFTFTGSIVKEHERRLTDWSKAASISVIAKDKLEADDKVLALMGDAGIRHAWEWKWHDITEGIES